MQYRNDTRLVDTGQPVQFFHDGYALRFIVGAFYQILTAVPQHEVVRYILFRLCTGKREQQSLDVYKRQVSSVDPKYPASNCKSLDLCNRTPEIRL